jgi:hypothetical protein
MDRYINNKSNYDDQHIYDDDDNVIYNFSAIVSLLSLHSRYDNNCT